MYNQMKAGSISPDLICPSDYMIQKMEREGMLEKFDYDTTLNEYGDKLSILYDGNTAPFETTYKVEGNKLTIKDSLDEDVVYNKK